MKSYKQLINHVMKHGEIRTDRTGVGTVSVFGAEFRHNLAEGFPLLTTKKVKFKNVLTELLWFLRGGTDLAYLHEHGCHIWDPWAKDGKLGRVYGAQWRDWRGLRESPYGETTDGIIDIDRVRVDQIEKLVNGLIENPDSRRHIVSAWNPAEVDDMALPPCHTLFQCYVHTDRRLSLRLYARSIDAFIGLPYNIASYAILLHILAHTCGYTPGDLSITFGDLHVYANHMQQVNVQMNRNTYPLPKLTIMAPPRQQIDAYTHDDFLLEDYQSHDFINAPVAV